VAPTVRLPYAFGAQRESHVVRPAAQSGFIDESSINPEKITSKYGPE
jgi:hypothetical protein